MENNKLDLDNAVVIAENPETAFIVESNRLHAVDQRVSEQREDHNPEHILPLMKKALQALINYAEHKVPPHFVEMGKELVNQSKADESEFVEKIRQIYSHLPRHARNELSSLVHHKQQLK